jgi:pilus assembly protein CpaF
MEGDVIVTQDIFVYDYGDGRSLGRFHPTGIKPRCCDKLAASGAGVKDEWFS